MIFLVICFAILFGLGIGSFLNVVILRTHAQEKLTGRSHCVHCHTTLHWYELLPVISFVLSAGQCRHCHKPISWQYPLVEAITAALTVFYTITWWNDWWRLGLLLPIIYMLIVIFVYDARYYLIPDLFTIPALCYGIVVSLILGMSWFDVVVGIGIGAGLFALQYGVSRGRWIGGGDIRLGAVMGVILGWPNVVAALFLAYVTGAVVALPLLFSRQKQLTDRLPFGTFLVVATLATLVWGNDLLSWYVHTLLHL